MNTFFKRFEELSVAITFAEAGAYEAIDEKIYVRCSDPVRVHAL